MKYQHVTMTDLQSTSSTQPNVIVKTEASPRLLESRLFFSNIFMSLTTTRHLTRSNYIEVSQVVSGISNLVIMAVHILNRIYPMLCVDYMSLDDFCFFLCKYTNWIYACFEITHRIYTITVEPLYNTVYYRTLRHKACQREVHDKEEYEPSKTFHISSSIRSGDYPYTSTTRIASGVGFRMAKDE